MLYQIKLEKGGGSCVVQFMQSCDTLGPVVRLHSLEKHLACWLVQQADLQSADKIEVAVVKAVPSRKKKNPATIELILFVDDKRVNKVLTADDLRAVDIARLPESNISFNSSLDAIKPGASKAARMAMRNKATNATEVDRAANATVRVLVDKISDWSDRGLVDKREGLIVEAWSVCLLLRPLLNDYHLKQMDGHRLEHAKLSALKKQAKLNMKTNLLKRNHLPQVLSEDAYELVIKKLKSIKNIYWLKRNSTVRCQVKECLQVLERDKVYALDLNLEEDDLISCCEESYGKLTELYARYQKEYDAYVLMHRQLKAHVEDKDLSQLLVLVNNTVLPMNKQDIIKQELLLGSPSLKRNFYRRRLEKIEALIEEVKFELERLRKSAGVMRIMEEDLNLVHAVSGHSVTPTTKELMRETKAFVDMGGALTEDGRVVNPILGTQGMSLSKKDLGLEQIAESVRRVPRLQRSGSLESVRHGQLLLLKVKLYEKMKDYLKYNGMLNFSNCPVTSTLGYIVNGARQVFASKSTREQEYLNKTRELDEYLKKLMNKGKEALQKNLAAYEQFDHFKMKESLYSNKVRTKNSLVRSPA